MASISSRSDETDKQKQIATKLAELKAKIIDKYDIARKRLVVQKSASAERVDLFYQNQWQFLAECDSITQELKIPHPFSLTSLQRDICVLGKVPEKENMFEGLEQDFKRLYLGDKLPPSTNASFSFIGISDIESLINTEYSLDHLDFGEDRQMVKATFTSKGFDGVELSQSKLSKFSFGRNTEQSKNSTTMLRENTKSTINDTQLNVKGPRTLLIDNIVTKGFEYEVLITSKPLKLTLGKDPLVIRAVYDGVCKDKGIIVNDVIMSINDKPASMMLLMQEELPLRLTVYRPN